MKTCAREAKIEIFSLQACRQGRWDDEDLGKLIWSSGWKRWARARSRWMATTTSLTTISAAAVHKRNRKPHYGTRERSENIAKREKSWVENENIKGKFFNCVNFPSLSAFLCCWLMEISIELFLTSFHFINFKDVSEKMESNFNEKFSNLRLNFINSQEMPSLALNLNSLVSVCIMAAAAAKGINLEDYLHFFCSAFCAGFQSFLLRVSYS